ncbi:site-2 protease family protein [Skermania sp. ID1734]|uniref:site-2 protease family protein n=1 Tax=Skermania sp. ID1734 TaxID=2597516 RepID=UPI0011815AC2|nr:site-2 protease family protein [Skermania sp. ID1734]TSD94426.1 site-2 protease family protein [Skermania sp. ID1734]
MAARALIRPSPVFLGVLVLAVAGGVIAWRSDVGSTAARIGVVLLVVFGWIVTVCLHEFAHAYLAWRAGDQDVQVRGYLTLNPLRYSHPLLSIVLPVAFIALGGIGLPGGAVYVHSDRFSPRVQRLISLAGPAVNALAAVVLLGAAATVGSSTSHPAFWFGVSFLGFLQVTATILNLLPVPGLDGYTALEPSLDPKLKRSLDQYKGIGLLAVMALLFVPRINAAFFSAIFWLFGLSGVPVWWLIYGADMVRIGH